MLRRPRKRRILPLRRAKETEVPGITSERRKSLKRTLRRLRRRTPKMKRRMRNLKSFTKSMII